MKGSDLRDHFLKSDCYVVELKGFGRTPVDHLTFGMHVGCVGSSFVSRLAWLQLKAGAPPPCMIQGYGRLVAPSYVEYSPATICGVPAQMSECSVYFRAS